MNIEWRASNAIVVSQMLRGGEVGTIDIKIYMDGQRYSVADFSEEATDDLYRSIFLYHNTDSLLTEEARLEFIALEMGHWCPATESRLVEWLTSFHTAIRARCLSICCESGYPGVPSLCWQVERVNYKFALLFERCPSARSLHQRLLVIACQELLKLYERLRDNHAESSSQSVLNCLSRLLFERNHIAGWRPYEQRKKAYRGTGYHDEIEEFASSWPPYRHEHLCTQRRASVNHLITIALSSMLAMSVVLMFNIHLMKQDGHLTLSLLILICLLYGGRDVVKEVLKVKITKLLNKFNFYRRYKLIRPGSFRIIGKRKTRMQSQFSPHKASSRLCLQKAESISVAKRLSKHSISVYCETQISLNNLDKYRKTQHFRVLNQHGESERTPIRDNRDLHICIQITQSNRNTITKSFRCNDKDNSRWFEIKPAS
ncbi:hypothetical protein [Vibrio mediterranei]|uniref:hypothetical protein n=1 Tax=Vibrio mediterranei TaxID=689 RepID=UPI004068314B